MEPGLARLEGAAMRNVRHLIQRGVIRGQIPHVMRLSRLWTVGEARPIWLLKRSLEWHAFCDLDE